MTVRGRNSDKEPPRRGGRKASAAPRGRRRKRAQAQARRDVLKHVSRWATIAGLWAGLTVGAICAFYAYDLPNIASLWDLEAGASVTFIDKKGRRIATRGISQGQAVGLQDLPTHVIEAVLATEDRRFYSHFGIDIVGLGRALVANLREGRVVQGGSTITQQLAKNVFLDSERTLKRKVQEAMLALWLEQRFSKNQILTLYLNRVYLGAGTYGIEAAAQRYFQKSASELNLSEAAMIAGLLKAPSRYAPTENLPGAQARGQLVLANMVSAGYITDEEKAHAAVTPPRLARSAASPSANYFIDWGLDQIAGYLGRAESDLIVETTLDLDSQLQAEIVLREHLAREGGVSDVEEGALLALGPTGAIEAMVGGRSYGRSQFNRAVQARRQPGSAFKPFVYLTALEAGWKPERKIWDGPVNVGAWAPKNYSERYQGEVTLTQGLAYSLNSVAVRVSERVGRRQVVRTARRLGITSPLKAHPSIALGTSELTLLELTAAYVPFANGGEGIIPHGIIRIRTTDGEVLYERQGSGPGRVVSPRALQGMNAMLREVMASGTGRAGRLDAVRAAGKTGTSQGFRDAWFVGYTPGMTVGVWTGNDNGRPMNEVTGGKLPARIWKDFMVRSGSDGPAVPAQAPAAQSLEARLEEIRSPLEESSAAKRLASRFRTRFVSDE